MTEREPRGLRALVLDPATDNVAVAVAALSMADPVRLGDQDHALRAAIPFGHKFAIRVIRAGDPVTKYGETIGIATADIAPGDHVHVHNVVSSRLPGPEDDR